MFWTYLSIVRAGMGGAEEVWGHFYSADTDRDLALTRYCTVLLYCTLYCTLMWPLPHQPGVEQPHQHQQPGHQERQDEVQSHILHQPFNNQYVYIIFVSSYVCFNFTKYFFLFFQIFLKIFPNIFFLFFQIFLKSQRTWHQRIYVFYLCKPTGVSGCQLSVHFISPYSNVKWLQSVEITLWEIKV